MQRGRSGSATEHFFRGSPAGTQSVAQPSSRVEKATPKRATHTSRPGCKQAAANPPAPYHSICPPACVAEQKRTTSEAATQAQYATKRTQPHNTATCKSTSAPFTTHKQDFRGRNTGAPRGITVGKIVAQCTTIGASYGIPTSAPQTRPSAAKLHCSDLLE
jgi:hypothetical protein